jgi:hypothetical protein
MAQAGRALVAVRRVDRRAVGPAADLVAVTGVAVAWPVLDDDAATRSVDVMPTIADLVGIEVPWDLDGTPASDVAAAPPRPLQIQDRGGNRLGDPDPDGFVAIDGEQGRQRLAHERALEADGPDAVWQAVPDLPLVGRRVDGLPPAPSPTGPSPPRPRAGGRAPRRAR